MTIILMTIFNVLWFCRFNKVYMRGITFQDFTSSALIYGFNAACILAWAFGLSL